MKQGPDANRHTHPLAALEINQPWYISRYCMRPFGRPGRVWWYQISMRLEVTNRDNPFLLGLTFGALGTSINTVSLWLSSMSYQYCYAAAENDSRLGPTWDRLYIYSQRRVTTAFVQTLENVPTQHWKISVYVSMEMSVSFVHALQDITRNVMVHYA